MQAIPMALMAAGSIVKGIGGLQAGNAAYKAAKRDARETIATSNEEQIRVQHDARQQIGQQLAAQFGNGFLGGTGSALDYLHESQVNAALDVLTLRRDAEYKAANQIYEGKLRRREGRYALVGGILGAGSTVASGMNDWASAKAPS